MRDSRCVRCAVRTLHHREKAEIFGSNQYQIEVNYYLPRTDRITIVPALYVIGNLNNFSHNPTVFVGHLRTYFSF